MKDDHMVTMHGWLLGTLLSFHWVPNCDNEDRCDAKIECFSAGAVVKKEMSALVGTEVDLRFVNIITGEGFALSAKLTMLDQIENKTTCCFVELQVQ